MKPHRTTDRTLKLSGNKVVVPLKQEVYDKDDVPESDDVTLALLERIERVEHNTKEILRREIERLQYNLKQGRDEPPLKPDIEAHYKKRLAEAQECLDYYD